MSAISVLVLVGAVVVAGFAVVSNLASHIHRVRVAHLDAVVQHAGGPSGTAENVLITSSDDTGAIRSVGDPADATGLIMILHINADQQAGGVVSIRPTTFVRVPGHGVTEIGNAVIYGGASLLVQTVENVTHVPIAHYARIDFAHVSNVVDAVGGVDVTLPAATTSFGHTFHPGVNHLNGTTAVYYARQPSLTENGRVLRQQSLIRAVLKKIADDHLLTNPVTMVNVLNALTSMLTVDSNFTNGQLVTLARELGGLSSSAGTFVTAPTHFVGSQQLFDTAVSSQLWTAINQDSIAAFARKYPQTITPEAVP